MWEETQFVCGVDGDSVPQVETRHSAFRSQIVAVLRVRYAPCARVYAVRGVVDGLRPRISSIQVEVARQPLLECQLQCVVVGVCRGFEIIDERQLRELCVERPPLLTGSRRAGRGLIEIADSIQFYPLGTDV